VQRAHGRLHSPGRAVSGGGTAGLRRLGGDILKRTSVEIATFDRGRLGILPSSNGDAIGIDPRSQIISRSGHANRRQFLAASHRHAFREVTREGHVDVRVAA